MWIAPASPTASDAATALGLAVQILCETPRNLYRLASICAFLEPPIALGQITFAFDPRGVATGYVTWAFVTPEVRDELADGPLRVLELPEWNEGAELMVMDLVSVSDSAAGLLRELRRRCPDHEQAWWRRHDRAGPRGALRRARLRRRSTALPANTAPAHADLTQLSSRMSHVDR